MLLLNKTILTGLLALLLSATLQGQTLDWGSRFTNAVTGGIFHDAQGNIITIGSFQSSVDFDPGPLTHYLVHSGPQDMYILKLTPEGKLIWVKRIGGPDYDFAVDFTQDKDGNMYLTGVFNETVDFDPGPAISILKSNGGYDVFVEKLDSAGNFIWARSFGRQSDEDVTAIRVDTAGNVYTSGSFFQSVDFDPGPDTVLLTAPGLNEDVFIQKLDADGNFVWVKQFGGAFRDVPSGMELDPAGNVWVCGGFTGPAILQDTLTVDTTLSGSIFYDIFLLHLAPDAQLLHAMWFGDAGIDRGGILAVDSLGGILLSGSFGKTVDFDPGPDTFLLSTVKQYDGFLLRLDADAKFQWVKQFGGGTYDSNGTPLYQAPTFQSLLFDKNGQIFISGSFEGTADFDPGPAEYLVQSIDDSYDIYIQKLTPEGNLVWVQTLGNTSLDGGCWTNMDAHGNLLLTGNFKFSIDIDPGPGVTTLQTSSFIAKWQQGFDFYGTIFQDTNANHVFDPGERPLPGVVVEVPGVGQYASTNSFGQYHIDANLVGDTLRPVLPRPYWTATPAFQVADTNLVQMDFAVFIPVDVQDLAISALELDRFRPGEETEFWVGLHNFGDAASDSAIVKLVFHELPGSWIFPLGSTPPVSQIIGDTLWWDIDSIQPDSNYFIKLKFFTAANAVPGIKLAWDAEVILPGDVDTLNNIFRDSTVIFGPYDPNDKQVSPRQATVEALDATRLRYTIRFQNVGNAPAGTVVIRDTLPANLQIASLRLLSASHAFDWKLSGPGLLEIRFPGINLPDSTSNEPGSHGYVLFEILPGQQLVAGDSVLNRAGIYFDLNASVLTPYAVFQVVVDNDGDGFDNLHDCNDQEAGINPAAVDIPGNGIDENCDGQDGTVSGVHSPQIVRLQVQPNPAQGRVQVILEQAASGVLEVHAADGKRVLVQTIEQQSFIWLNLDNNPPGVYMVRLLEQGKCVGLGQVVLR